jgi:molybdopterin/thiamine biosynthesis adenylyltransferase
MLKDEDLERYARQVIMPAVGEDGQARLLQSRVLIVGAGGLGAPVILYLAAAGVGHLTIIDDDAVSLTDLNRQVIYRNDGIGMTKATTAAAAARGLNPRLSITPEIARVNAENVDRLVMAHDVVIDCTDNAETRYLVGDAAHRCGRPLVFGGAVRMEGQVSVFQSGIDGHRGSACYRCVFPAPPDASLAPGCSEAGILGPVAGMVGTLQAMEAMKLILGMPDTLTGRLLLIDASSGSFMEIQTAARPDCSCCGAP